MKKKYLALSLAAAILLACSSCDNKKELKSEIKEAENKATEAVAAAEQPTPETPKDASEIVGKWATKMEDNNPQTGKIEMGMMFTFKDNGELIFNQASESQNLNLRQDIVCYGTYKIEGNKIITTIYKDKTTVELTRSYYSDEALYNAAIANIYQALFQNSDKHEESLEIMKQGDLVWIQNSNGTLKLERQP